MATRRRLACCRALPQSFAAQFHGAHGAPYVEALHTRFPGMSSACRVHRAHQLQISQGAQGPSCGGGL